MDPEEDEEERGVWEFIAGILGLSGMVVTITALIILYIRLVEILWELVILR
jgi:hypothetical protein